MAYKRNYQPYNLDQADRKVLNITNFGGVDFATQKFNVSSHRAIDIKNFVYRDGMIQKRFGYEQVYKVYNNTYIDYETKEEKTNPNNFNGLWKFLAEDEQEHIIAHIGNVLYEVNNIGGDNIALKMVCVEKGDMNDKLNSTYELLNQKSFAFASGKKLWILGGINYLCVRFKAGEPTICKVTDLTEVYIPTTTRNIVETFADVDAEYTRQNEKAVNLLTQWRKNICITGIPRKENINASTRSYEYQLDAPIYLENSETDKQALKINKSFDSISDKTKKDMASFKIVITTRKE